MPTTVEAIHADIDAAVVPGFRNRLLARGQARAMVWRDGVLPPDSPAFTPQLSNDLLGYGYALLELGLRLRDLEGDQARARLAFEQAATALEAAIARGPREGADRSFHFVIAAASYHLARLSARAYSLLTIIRADENFSRIERVLAQLMLRDLEELEATVLAFRVSGVGSDDTIADSLENQLLVDELVGRPENQLDDFACWLRRDQPGHLIKSEWRPTRLRYGEVLWNGQSARLNLRVGEERPFVPRYLTAFVPPIGKRRTPFPKDLGELCLATAWRLVDDGQSVLVFCPVRAHVEPFADRIIDLHRRGAS